MPKALENTIFSGWHLLRSEHTKKRTKQSLRSFFIQSKGLVCNLTAGEYGIAAGVWHHAPACIFLRIDSIHHFVMIPYGTSCQFHAATSCAFHPRLRRVFLFSRAKRRRLVGGQAHATAPKFVLQFNPQKPCIIC